MTTALKVQCCIVGGGPAGMMLGYLLGRAGVGTLVLEKHADFLRDFRGDTVHPSTLRILQELGLLENFLARPHAKIRAMGIHIGDVTFKIADFARLPPPCNFIALMPQWDFLDFLAGQGHAFASLDVKMCAEVTALRQIGPRTVGVAAVTRDGPLEVTADLVVGCDGRSSLVRREARLEVQDLGSPIDVLWFRLSRKVDDPRDVFGFISVDKMIVTIDRNDYWQCAYIITKGGSAHVRAQGIEAFRRAVASGARFLADRVDELSSFDDVRCLSVAVDRLVRWSRPGLLCIGDAAHAMSPVGGVGINLAIQDAVAAANLLADKLKAGTLVDADLKRVMRRRLLAVKLIQAAQIGIHNRVLKPVLAGGSAALAVAPVVKLLNRSAWLRRWPAQLIGFGVRPEHVCSPNAL